MPLNKPQLLVLNQVNFPDNTQQLITPVLLRDFNTQMINSMELTQSMDAYANLGTANLFYGGNQSIAKEYKLVANGVYWNDSTVGYNNLEIINSATGNLDLAALNGGVRIVSSSLNITNGTFTASLQEGFTYVGNGNNRTTLVSTSSFGSSIDTGSFATTGSNTFIGNQTIVGNITFPSGAFNSSTTGSLYFSALNGGTLYLNADGGEGDVQIGYIGSPSKLKIDTNTEITGALGVSLIKGTGSLTLQPDQNDSRVIGIYNTAATDTHITGSGGNLFLGNDETYVLVSTYGNQKKVTLRGDESITASGSLDISGSLTSSLEQGYVWVGDSNGRTVTVATSSFSTPIPAGTISSSAQITSLGFVSSSVTASSLVTASFSGNTLTFTKGDASTFGVVIPDVSGSTINTGSFATTGSNVFIGDESFSDASGNFSTLTPFSGSLVFTPKGGIASSSSLQNHLLISASATGISNLSNIIFNTFAQGSPTGSVIISGSNNIFTIPGGQTAGFQRRIGLGNLMLAGAIPQFTSSMSNVPVVYNGNVSTNAAPIIRGPISSSAYNLNGNLFMAGGNFGDATESMVSASAGMAFNVNLVLNAPTFRAGRTQLVANVAANNNLFGHAAWTTTLASSSVTYNNNSFYGTSGAFINVYFAPSASAANQRVEFLHNLIGGQSTQFYASGSNTTTTFNRQINNNFVGGNFCIVSASANGDNSSLLGTIVYGNNLRVNGNSPYNAGVGTAGYGSTFIGRFNDETGTKALTANTIFAVGTGTASSGFFRKTGFLIDSGSNTFVEGTLNVSGSTSFNGAVNITGSLTSSLTLGYVWVGGAGNVSTLVATSSFAGGSVPAGTISGSSQITALGFVSSSVTASSLITASVNLNTITFTKGDASTFAITVNTGSGGGTVPAGTVSSSAQILGYNIFATTGSNTFTGQQIIRSGGGLELAPTIGGGGTDNYINLASLNQQTLMIANTSVSSGYQSGSLLQISAGTGSNGYGFSGSAGFQMDSLYNGYKASMKVQSINGVGSQLTGVGDTIIFVGREGFGDTNADKFQVDADSIDLNGAVSLSGSLTIENGTGNLFVHGNKQFNVGAFQSNVSQSGSANVSQSMNFEVTDISEGVSIVSNSQITLAHSGTYNIQFSAQILADTGADDVYIWLKKNGTNVSASAGHVVLANNEELIASWNYVVSAAASDYFEIVWQNTNGDAILLTENASGNIPSVPSVILTVTQVR